MKQSNLIFKTEIQKRFPILMILLFFGILADAQIAEPEKLSPFTAVKWEGDSAIVQIENGWYGLASIDGISMSQFKAYCQKHYGATRWKKRFSEDLVEVMTAIGQTPKSTVALMLWQGGKQIKKTGAMTHENRQAVWSYNKTNLATDPTTATPEAVKPGGTPGASRNPRNAAEMVAAGYKRYPIESGRVEYLFEGSKKGTEILYFDMWGWREAAYEKSSMKVLGKEQNSESVRFLDGEWMITYNPETNYAIRTSNPMIKNLTEKMDSKNLTEIGEKMMEGMGGKVVGVENIAGKECKKWEIPKLGSTAWVWKGLTLKENSTLMGITVTKTAQVVDTGSKAPAEKLTVPKDAKGISSPMPSRN